MRKSDDFEELICVERSLVFPKDKTTLLYTDIEDVMEKLGLYPNNKLLNQKGICLERRKVAETRNDIIQMVVAAVIRCGDKFVLLKSKSDCMKGKVTLLQGHVSYSPFYPDTKLIEILKKEIKREFNEEIYIKAPELILATERLLFDLKNVKFIMLNNHDPESLDYKHLGFVFEINIDESLKDLITYENIESSEQDKHDVLIWTINDELKNPCSWSKEVLEYYKK